MTTCRSSLLEMQAWSSGQRVGLDIHTQYERDHRCVLQPQDYIHAPFNTFKLNDSYELQELQRT